MRASDNKTSIPRAHASVIVRSKSGKSAASERLHITPKTVKAYLPDQASLEHAARELTALGLRVDLVAPTHLSISAEFQVMERVFGGKLVLREYPLFASDRSKARQLQFATERSFTIPPQLAKIVEAVALEPAVIYYTTATPPALGYDHMEVPDDVARGMDSIKAHERGITGAGISLAMVDTGFMTPWHPYYAGRGYAINPVVSDPLDATPGADDYGHGTGISACALAVAPGASYTVYKIGTAPVAAFSRAAMANPHVITNSWGLFGLDTALQLSINNAVANGIVVLFAAGNGGPAAWPGSEPAVISVGGAFLGSDDSIQASSYASSGTNADDPGRQVPDLCGLVGQAPQGVYIALPTQPNSTVDNDFAGGAFPNGDETPPNDGWVVASGTSSATPMVAGVCALLMQADPTMLGNPAAVRAKLVASCIDVTAGASASGEAAGIGPDNATGAGLVQAYRAVHSTDLWMRDNPDSDIGLVPTTGRRPAYPPFTHWTSPDIKVVAAILADPQADFDGAPEVAPIFNQDNYVYMRVRNRGTVDAASVQARLYYADPSTSLSFPHDWKDGSTGIPAAGSIAVGGVTTNLQTLAAVPANGSFVTPLPFVWRPPDPSTATQNQTLPDGRIEGHFCLLSRLSSADDPLIFPGGSEASVLNDNNISMKNEQVYSAPAAGSHFFTFIARHAKLETALREFTLVADVAGLPALTEIELTVPARHIKERFTVRHADNKNGHSHGGHDRGRDRDEHDRDEHDRDDRDADGRRSATTAVATRPRHEPEREHEHEESTALTLATLALKPGEDVLTKVRITLPAHTRRGRYPMSIGQLAGSRLIGGVSLIARVT